METEPYPQTGVTILHSGKSSEAFILMILWDDYMQGLPLFLKDLDVLYSGIEIILIFDSETFPLCFSL